MKFFPWKKTLTIFLKWVPITGLTCSRKEHNSDKLGSGWLSLHVCRTNIKLDVDEMVVKGTVGKVSS